MNKDREDRIEKERCDEYKRRYDSDIDIYLKIKNEIETTNEKVPPLFKNQYPIFKILEKLNMLNTNKGFLFYYDKMKNINEKNNTIYSGIFNDESFFYTPKENNNLNDSSDSGDENSINSDSNTFDLDNNLESIQIH